METKNKVVPKKYKKESQWKEIWRRMRKNRAAMIGLCIFAFIVLVAIFADVIVPYDYGIANAARDRLQPPSAEHLFGTDGYGRDIFARVVHGSRVSLMIGLSTTVFSLVVGGLLGAAAGYYGGKVDDIIMRACDIVMSIPGILLALAIIAALGASTINLLIAITISSVPGSVRLVRSTILTVVEQDFIEAARSYGSSDMRIIVKYILPNAVGPIIVNTTMSIAGMILSAAGLSFIGMGIQPPQPEWGAMLSEARQYMTTSPYMLYFPGIAIVLTALSLNLIGDGLRDALDPKLKD
jgi:peptide/nickel transport system permease protein